MRLLQIGLASLLFSQAIAGSAGATRYYVDAVNGSDTAGTGSASAPWRTITHAVAQVPGPADVLLVLPGTYDQALGEVFPIELDAATLSLEGAGSADCILDGGGATSVLAVAPAPVSWRASGLTIRNADRGVQPASAFGLGSVEIEDLRFEALTFVAISARALSAKLCTFDGCGTGISAGASNSTANLTVDDSRFVECGTGVSVISISSSGSQGIAFGLLTNCALIDCVIGASVSHFNAGAIIWGFSQLTLQGCSVTGSDQAIVAIGDSNAILVRSTLASNQKGISASASLPEFVFAGLHGANLWGNAQYDVEPSLVLSPNFLAEHSNAATLWAGPGNLSADPLFVDPAGGDFHLAPGSPLIDRGLPAAAPSGLDADNDPLVGDGDGDGVARADIGADEHNPVHVTSSGAPALGATVALLTSAPLPSSYCLGLAVSSADIPLGSFGNLLLDPATTFLLGCDTVPGSDDLLVPADPTLSGVVLHAQAFAWQALPFPGWLSNRLDLAIP